MQRGRWKVDLGIFKFSVNSFVCHSDIIWLSLLFDKKSLVLSSFKFSKHVLAVFECKNLKY